uniref:Transmembrane protein n=1 Tax=Rhipicephalus pulchellus TaxID=72859 RepID=L7LZ07_RHIPC
MFLSVFHSLFFLSSSLLRFNKGKTDNPQFVARSHKEILVDSCYKRVVVCFLFPNPSATLRVSAEFIPIDLRFISYFVSLNLFSRFLSFLSLFPLFLYFFLCLYSLPFLSFSICFLSFHFISLCLTIFFFLARNVYSFSRLPSSSFFSFCRCISPFAFFFSAFSFSPSASSLAHQTYCIPRRTNRRMPSWVEAEHVKEYDDKEDEEIACRLMIRTVFVFN